MIKFMDDDFLLSTESAKKLFASCRNEPIFDWHCHLSPQEIYENQTPTDITALWLGGDHYKWRAMRSMGISEKYITGDSSSHEKFQAWAKAMPYLIGNPLYHWTHLELQRYFDIDEPLSAASCERIWEETNRKIQSGGFTPRALIEKSHVACVATTDDPADSLAYHQLLAKEADFSCKVIPAFRPDKAVGIDLPAFLPWLQAMEQCAGQKITDFTTLCEVLKERIAFFDSLGCRASDQALSYIPCVRMDKDKLNLIFKKAIHGETLTAGEIDGYKTELLRVLAKEYDKHGWAMEIHIGAMRNNNTKMFRLLGPDAGYDSIDDAPVAVGLSRFLDSLAVEDSLPKTILFCLNPKDNYVLGSMLGNFQNDEAPSKIQFGSAWWFNDNIDGMRQQMRALMNLGVLSKFVGMVTDSRSFLSYPRHEYFRRILCDLLGGLVENGEYPADFDVLSEIVRGVAFENAKQYFSLTDE